MFVLLMSAAALQCSPVLPAVFPIPQFRAPSRGQKQPRVLGRGRLPPQEIVLERGERERERESIFAVNLLGKGRKEGRLSLSLC